MYVLIACVVVCVAGRDFNCGCHPPIATLAVDLFRARVSDSVTILLVSSHVGAFATATCCSCFAPKLIAVTVW